MPYAESSAIERETPRSMAPFIVLWTGQAFSLFGSRLVQFALVWWLTRESGSATVLAAATLMAMLPQILLGPFAGVLVDRWDRRRTMMLSDSCIALATVGLAALFALGRAQVWHILGLMFLRSLGGAFQWPAMQAATTMLVPDRHLARVGGMNQGLVGLAGIVAPPLGALLLDILPMQGILAIDVGTALPAVGSLAFIRIPHPEGAVPSKGAKPTGSLPRAMLHDLGEGLRLVTGWPALRTAIGMGLIINMLMMPATSLLPLMITNHFQKGALDLAFLQSLAGIGMVAGGMTLSVWGGFRRKVVTVLSALAWRGVGLALIGLAPQRVFGLAVVGATLAHFMTPILDGAFMAMLQATVPAHIQGRVFTLLQSGFMLAVPIGLAMAGPAADVFGVRIPFIVAGAATVLLAAYGASNPVLGRFERESAPTIGRAQTAEE
ncbi:MAG: MFS transporter [Chloroflexi bacterium]|nr:MFS transporter [Chloroflexota bacterium]